MKKLLLVSFVAVFCACNTESDVDPAIGSFLRYFGSENNHTAVLALEVNEGYTLLSNLDIQTDQTFTNKIKLSRTDLNGNLLWEKSYPAFETRSNRVSLKASSFIPLINSGYLIVGDSIKVNASTGQNTTDLLLLFLDQEGTLQRTATISLTAQAPDVSLHGRAVIEDTDGNLIILGKMEGAGTVDMYVAKYSVQGDSILWERKYGAGASTLINRIYTRSDKNILWAGSVENSSKSNVRIVRAPEDSQAAIIGNGIGEPDINEFANDFCEAIGGWAITGSTNKDGDTDIYYLKVSNNSDVIFSQSINMDGSNDEGNSICESADKSLVILGTVESEATQKDLYLTKVDLAGTQLWNFKYGGADDQTGASVRQLTDGSYLIFGTTSFGRVKKLMLMKVNQDGKL